MACIRKRRGKWVVDYYDGAGVRRWKTCETRREAEDFLDQERPKTRQWNKPVVDPSILLAVYADRWFQLIHPTIKPKTYRRYEELWRLHLKPIFGNIQVRQLHRGRIKAYLAAKLSELKPHRKRMDLTQETSEQRPHDTFSQYGAEHPCHFTRDAQIRCRRRGAHDQPGGETRTAIATRHLEGDSAGRD